MSLNLKMKLPCSFGEVGLSPSCNHGTHSRPERRRLHSEPDDAWMLSGLPRLRHPLAHEKFRSPGAVRVALSGPVRAVDRLRRDGRPAVLHRAGGRLPAAAHPFRQPEPQTLGRRKDRHRSKTKSSFWMRARPKPVLRSSLRKAGSAISRCSERATRPCTETTKSGKASCCEQRAPARCDRAEGKHWPAVSKRAAASSIGCGTTVRLADARLKELRECSARAATRATPPGSRRRMRDIADEKSDRATVLARYKMAQPYINRYLPDDSFKTLLLLIGLVMIGRGAQGLLPVPPGSPGRRRHAADPLRHPQPCSSAGR